MVLGTIGMLWLTRLDVDSVYASGVLPALILLGLAMGSIMPGAMQTATLGVDRHFAGVASAMVNTSQQVGGSIGTALLNTVAATVLADALVAHAGDADAVTAATIAGYTAAFAWGAVFFAFGAVLTVLLFRTRRSTAAVLAARAAEADESAGEPEPVVAH